MTFLQKAQFEELSLKRKHSLSYQERNTTT